MLVYIRKFEWERITSDTGKQHLPEKVREQLDKEHFADEKQHKEKQEAHLCVNIRLATEFHFISQIGQSCDCNSASLDAVKQHRVHKNTPFEDFKEIVSKNFGIPKHL